MGGQFTHVLIHDAARPCCSPKYIRQMLSELSNEDGLVLGVPAVNTIKKVDTKGNVIETLDREQLFEIQTPQIFPLNRLIKSFDKALKSPVMGTYFDDASVFEEMGYNVKIVLGSKDNLKITTSLDLPIANLFVDKLNK